MTSDLPRTRNKIGRPVRVVWLARVALWSLKLSLSVLPAIGCAVSGQPRIAREAPIAIALDASKPFSERRDAALELSDEDLRRLRSTLQAGFRPGAGRPLWDDLDMMATFGDAGTADLLEKLLDTPMFFGDTGIIRAQIMARVELIRRGVTRDPSKDVRLNGSELRRLLQDTGEIPPREGGIQLYYKDKDGTVYLKPGGSKTRGFPVGYL